MNSDYNDVDKLLSHMHLNDFAYRSFKHGDSAAPLRVVRSAGKPADPLKPEAASCAETASAQLVVVKAPVIQPISVRSVPVTAAAATPAAAGAAPASSRISDALERLKRGSISDSAPKVNLHLELPLRPEPQEISLPAMAADRPVGDVFQRLRALAVLPPKAAGRGER
ncbi:MAG: hypothetical protein JWR07_41 [Nevskia sp.]|nr:hypothetical protein [Nevskia sp.]